MNVLKQHDNRNDFNDKVQQNNKHAVILRNTTKSEVELMYSHKIILMTRLDITT